MDERDIMLTDVLSQVDMSKAPAWLISEMEQELYSQEGRIAKALSNLKQGNLIPAVEILDERIEYEMEGVAGFEPEEPELDPIIDVQTVLQAQKQSKRRADELNILRLMQLKRALQEFPGL